MKKVLITYCTNAGSTAEIAAKLAEEFRAAGQDVTCESMDQNSVLDSYDAVLIGAPMIFGWHAAAIHFLKKNQVILSRKKVAYFCTLLNLTQESITNAAGMPVFVDPRLAKPARNPAHLSLRERYASLANYLRPIQKTAPQIHPLQVAMLGGKLDLGKLNFIQLLFVLAVIRAQPGDFRNWPAIRQWAQEIIPLL
jgi:menaquinone-dependent protoporphyrinogen IX oxidase